MKSKYPTLILIFILALSPSMATAEEKNPERFEFPQVIILPIDYTKSLEELIGAGNYDWKHPELTSQRFAIAGEGIVEYEFRYFHFNFSVLSETAVDLIKNEDSKNPWEPAQSEHLLAVGEKFPDEQRKYPIVALGSVGKLNGFLYVPCLGMGGAKRVIDILWWKDEWHGRCRFLAVRKVTRISEP